MYPITETLPLFPYHLEHLERWQVPHIITNEKVGDPDIIMVKVRLNNCVDFTRLLNAVEDCGLRKGLFPKYVTKEECRF